MKTKIKKYIRMINLCLSMSIIFSFVSPHIVISKENTYPESYYIRLMDNEVSKKLSFMELMKNGKEIPVERKVKSEKTKSVQKSGPDKADKVTDENPKRKTMTVRATAYCGCEICNGKWAGSPAADGSPLKSYHTIAAWSDIPFGTKVYIPYFRNSPNGGMFEVEDRGSAITYGRIDIYFSSHEQALDFRIKELEIEFAE